MSGDYLKTMKNATALLMCFGQKGAPRAPRQGKRVSEIVKSIQRLIITLCAARKSAEQRRPPRARDRQLPAIRGKTCSIIGRITMCVLKVSAQSTGQKLDRCQSALCQVPRASDGERERESEKRWPCRS